MFRLRGLGASPYLNPAMQATFDPNLVHGGGAGVYTAPTGPAGWTRFGIDVAKYRDWQRPMEDRVQAIQASLLTSYGALIRQSNGKLSEHCPTQASEGYMQLLTPVGLASNLGVAISGDQVLAALQAETPITPPTYMPNESQRWWADLAIYFESQRELAKVFGRSLANGSDLFLDLVRPERGIQAILDQRPESVEDVTRRFPFAWYLDGYGHNPIEPTTEERTQRGGLAAYYRRGGFLLGVPLGEGQYPVATDHLRMTTGYVLCGNTPIATYTGLPTGQRWETFITVNPAGYTMRVQLKDRSVGSQIISKTASVMKTISAVLCASQSTIATINQNTLLAELCYDAAKMPCKAGTPGCKCTKPTTGEQAMVGAANGVLSLWCSRGGFPGSQPQQQDPGFVPPIFNPPIIESKIPWWLVIGGGVVVGAALFARK